MFRKFWQSVNLFAMMVLCGAMLFSCTMAPAHADGLKPDVIGMHMFSVHSNNRDPVAERPWNNANPGIYFRWSNIVAGTYYNSIRKESYYVGYAYPVFNNLDMVVGVVSGYNGIGPGGAYRAKAIMPMLVPSVHFPINGNLSARINLAIGIGKGSATAINFALEYKL